MDKLSRLEHIIKRIASEGKDGADSAAAVAAAAAGPCQDLSGDIDAQQPSSKKSESETRQGLLTPSSEGTGPQDQTKNISSIDAQFGRLVISDSNSYYVGHVLWANLANEVSVTVITIID
jgi:hypothetical protein